MFPGSTAVNLRDCARCHRVLKRKSLLTSASVEFVADGYDLLCRELGTMVPLSSCPALGVQSSPVAITTRSSVLGCHVGKVAGVRSKKEVSRVAALPVGKVANWIAHVAIMADEQTVGDGAVGEDPGNTMSALAFAFIPVVAIAARVDTSLPWPTIIRSAPTDSCPEPLGKRKALVMAKDVPHRLTSDMTTTSVGPGRNPSLLTAPAVAEAAGDDRLRLHSESPTQIRSAAPRDVCSVAEAFACPQYST